MKYPSLSLVVGITPLVFVSMVAAATPDPAHCTVPNVLYDPFGAFTYVVTVRDASDNPLAGVTVELDFSTAADTIVCWCPGQVHPIISAVTDSQGQASFNIHAGGCIDPAYVGPPTIDVYADTTLLADVGAVSPDAVDVAGLFPWEGWSTGGECYVGLSDAVQHAGPISIRSYSFCTDLDSDGRVSLLEAVYVTAPIQRGDYCGP